MNLREAGSGQCEECGWAISTDETEIVLIDTTTGDFWRYHQGCASGAYYKALSGAEPHAARRRRRALALAGLLLAGSRQGERFIRRPEKTMSSRGG